MGSWFEEDLSIKKKRKKKHKKAWNLETRWKNQIVTKTKVEKTPTA